MIEPPIVLNEFKRLKALRSLQILDTPAEERFDQITRLAMQIFDVPIALISLIDADRQWFKSNQGLAIRQTPRSYSFCAHTFLKNKMIIVEDAEEDIRFYDNPLVTGAPFIRFYAGQPVFDSNGLPLGTLCIIDRRPRYLSAKDQQKLKDLALMAEKELNSSVFAEKRG